MKRLESIRGAMVNTSIVVWLVTGHCFGRGLLVDQGALLGGRSRSILRAGLARIGTASSDRGDETCIHRCSEFAYSETDRASRPNERHCGRYSGARRQWIAVDSLQVK